jgi:hypothetical protein
VFADAADADGSVNTVSPLMRRKSFAPQAVQTLPVPNWLAGDATGALVNTDISLTHIADWRCWRYRVFQTEVPLRNQLWAEQ